MASPTLRLTDYAQMADERDRDLQKEKTTPQPFTRKAHARMSEPHHSDLPEENMPSPTLTSTDRTPIPDRHHSDPPALWVAVTAGSVAVHVAAFGMLHLSLMAGFRGWQVDKALIPVEVIAVAPQATSPIQSTLTPSATAAGIPTPLNTPSTRPSDQGFNRQTSPISTPTSTPANSPSPSPQKSEPNQFQKESPVSGSPQKQSPETPTPPANSDSPSNNGQQPGGSTPPSDPNPVPPNPPDGQTSPDSQQGGGFGVFPGTLAVIDKQNDVIDTSKGDKVATLQQDSIQLSNDDLKSLGINAEQVIELKVVVLIASTGGASVNRTQVLRGNISSDKAEQLAKTIVERLRFDPTVMAGQAVDRDYYLTLTINPSENSGG